jgi:hypothetical protein
MVLLSASSAESTQTEVRNCGLRRNVAGKLMTIVMKKTSFIIAVVVIVAISCKSKDPCKISTLSNEQEMKSIFVKDFKLVYFKQLLRRGFNNDPGYLNAIKDDMSGFGENLYSNEDFDILNALVDKDNQVMVRDSLESYGKVADGVEGKRVFSYALERYNSKWLDSLAHARYKYYEARQRDF